MVMCMWEGWERAFPLALLPFPILAFAWWAYTHFAQIIEMCAS